MRTIEELKTIANKMNKSLENLLYEMLSDAMKELDQYKNNWEELKKYVKEAFKDTITVSNGIIYKNKPIFEEISNKMKELEEDK